MSTHTTLWLLLGLGVLAAGCGDNDDLVCETGTFRDGDGCVGADPNDKTAPVTSASPAGLRARSIPSFVVLSSEEANVTIHYTIDGSEPSTEGAGELSPVVVPSLVSGTTIKFFGVDPSGNVEATHAETYEADTQGPAAVTSLTATPSGQDAKVTWTNPTDADYAGTLLVRVSSFVDAEPTIGQLYAAATALSPSMQIVVAGTATTFTDTGLPTGPVRYVAWTYDDLGNYSEPVLVETNVGSLSTAATFTFDTLNNALTLTSAPASLDLTGTTADYVGATTTVTLHLSAKNLTGTVFQGPKILVSSATGGVFTGSSGTVGATPFKDIGPGWFAPGATKTVDLVFTTVVPTTTLTVNLDLGTAPQILAGWKKQTGTQPHRIVDTGSGIARTGLIYSSYGRGTGNVQGVARPGVLTAHRYYDVPTTEATIERWDMTTMTKVGGVRISTLDRENIMSLVRGSGGQTYAILRTGGYRNAGAISRVVRLNEALHSTGTLELHANHGKGANLAAVSPDGALLALPAQDSVAIVDLRTFTVKDVDASTDDVQWVTTSLADDDRARDIAWLNDSSGFVVVGRSGGVSVINLTATSYTEALFDDLGGKAGGAETLADGRVWIGTDGELVVYDPGTNMIAASAYPNGVTAMTQLAGELWVVRSSNRQTLDRLDGTGAVVSSPSFTAQTYGHWLVATKP
jgi:hypothetical protein